MPADVFFDLRNRLLTNATFRRVAQKLPFTQWVARRQANQLFRICSGFIHSQVLLACVRLDLFERLRDGPLPVHSIAAATGVDPPRLLQLLRSAAALRLLERRGADNFGLGVLGAAMTDNPSVTELVRHHALLYEDLIDPVELFSNPAMTTRLSQLWPYARSEQPESLHGDDVETYTALMAASQAMIAEQVLAAVSMRGYRRLLDIGGGAGAFVAAVARRWPHLQLRLVDLPAVSNIAEQRLADDGLGERVEVIGADVTAATLPADNDVVSLVRIVHDHDDDRALEILAAARSAMGPDGVLLMAEPLADARGAGPLIDAYFNVYLLAMGSGRPRSFEALSDLLRQAGFSRIRRRRTPVPLITSVVTASP